jgi:hypothetical protein
LVRKKMSSLVQMVRVNIPIFPQPRVPSDFYFLPYLVKT